jgi:hypothetical protein
LRGARSRVKAGRAGRYFPFPVFGPGLPNPPIIPARSRSKNGVASLAYVAGIHDFFSSPQKQSRSSMQVGSFVIG